MIICRPFSPGDQAACLALFDTNAPDAFAPAEREDYRRFLAQAPPFYRVCEERGEVVGAYGLSVDLQRRRGRIRWILTGAGARGRGLGRYMMRNVLEQAAARGVRAIDVAASQKSAPFFARYGAVVRSCEVEGWGPGLDRVEMVLRVAGATSKHSANTYGT